MEEDWSGVTLDQIFTHVAQDDEVARKFRFHSLRVMHFSRCLAKRMGYDDNDMRVAAFLHDIGKSGLSKEILFKPARLNDLEYLVIQSHSALGNNIVRKVLKMPRAAVFVRDHHERWDGTGYPRGLSQEDISIQGRIIGICDAFDTMTIDKRNYSNRVLTFQAAFDELKRCSWSQFDGDLVDVFIDMVSNYSFPPIEEWAEDEQAINEIFSHIKYIPSS